MRTVEIVFGVAWAAFWVYWLLAAFTAKRGHASGSPALRIRALMMFGVLVLIRLGAHQNQDLNTELWRALPGLVLFALGLVLAIWARVHIGRNWGTPMTRKEDPELVTSGPYRFVRHPIYSGILLAGIGTAMALSWWWLIAIVPIGVYFISSATIEERYMTERFPDAYPAYRSSTKMLVPFIF